MTTDKQEARTDISTNKVTICKPSITNAYICIFSLEIKLTMQLRKKIKLFDAPPKVLKLLNNHSCKLASR